MIVISEVVKVRMPRSSFEAAAGAAGPRVMERVCSFSCSSCIMPFSSDTSERP